MEKYHEDIVGCYLYTITKYGYPPDAAGTMDHLEEFSRLGFRSIEMEGIHERHLGQMYALREQIAGRAGMLGLQIPVFCIVLPGLSSMDEKERQRNLALFERGCEIASSLGSRAVLDNGPLPPWHFPEGIPVTRHYDEAVLARAHLPADLEWSRFHEGVVETYREACRMAAQRNLTFHLHPCFGSLVDSTDAFLNFASAVRSDNLRFNLDTANQFFMRENILLSLVRLKGRVDYIHLSDNRGVKLEHLIPGTGKVPWDEFFGVLDRIGYSGLFGIDVGGAETELDDLDAAYRSAAGWLTDRWFRHRTDTRS